MFNPWPIIGGTAMSCCSDEEFVMPVGGVPGDVLVLTKALGTQVAVNLNEWLQIEDNANWKKCAGTITPQQALHTYHLAVASMIRLNRTGARLMHKYSAHGATDVTGFGILGHASNLAQNQKASVDFEIHTLPVLPQTMEVDSLFTFFRLSKGYSSETSGGLLVILPADKADQFCTEIQEIDGKPAWIVGRVVPAKDPTKNNAYIVENPKVVVVDS